MKIINPNKNIIELILDMINHEFIISKGKKLHISKRYPMLFDEINYKNLFVGLVNNQICTFLAVKPIDLIFNGDLFKLFFIGSVYTNPIFRGKGYGTELLKYVTNKYSNMGFSCGVLWTSINRYYIKLGWIKYDNGNFLTCSHYDANIDYERSNFLFREISDFSKIDCFRIRYTRDYIIRFKNGIWGYNTVYSPGEIPLNICMLDSKENILAYLLSVVSVKTLIIYEAIASVDKYFFYLIDFIIKKYNFDYIKVNISDYDNHTTEIYKKMFRAYNSQKQDITMYYVINRKHFQKIKNYYIPFTDRI